MKKRGFGAGRWNGVGGKPEAGEALMDTAVREAEEEIRVTPLQPEKVAELDFFFPAEKSDNNQTVHVYLCEKWDGEPIETEEMSPKWVLKSEIPFDEMWSDDKVWLPLVLVGQKIRASFWFDHEDGFTRHELSEVKSF